MPKPLLIVGDGPTAKTGLGRIMGDLALRIATQMPDVYRIACAGYHGPTSRHLPYHQYFLEGVTDNFICPTLPEICDDFFGEERGIICFIWDCSRVGWFSQPEQIGGEVLKSFPGLKNWILKSNFEKWIYVPLDSSGPNDRLTFPLALTLIGFDRILAYGQFGDDVIRRTIGDEEAKKRHLAYLPHGIDTDVFFAMPQAAARKTFFKNTGAQPLVDIPVAPLQDGEALVGIIATNQHRKDWSMAIEAVSILSRKRPVRLWCHCDKLEQYWSIPALLADFKLLGNTVVSLGYLSDAAMARGYSATDVTLGIAPEGFGFCTAESMACGVPCVTGSYANGAALVRSAMTVDPIAYRYDGLYAQKRPVYDPHEWADKADGWIGQRTIMDPEYDWNVLWERWKEYLTEAAK